MPWPRLRSLVDDPSEDVIEDVLLASEEAELSDESVDDDDSSANAGTAESVSAAMRENDAILRIEHGGRNDVILLPMARDCHCPLLLPVRG